jgi:hypothetical protein
MFLLLSFFFFFFFSLIDVLYFRSLKEHHHIVWYSTGAYPDLGGNEFDEICMFALCSLFGLP